MTVVNDKPKLSRSILMAFGFAAAVVILGPLNPWIKQRALEERFGIQDDTWQQWALLCTWVFAIAIVYWSALALFTRAIKNRNR